VKAVSYEVEIRFNIRLYQSLILIFKAIKAKKFSIAFGIITHMLLGYTSLGPVCLSGENEIRNYLDSFNKEMKVIKNITFVDIFDTNDRTIYTPKQV